MLKLYDTLTRQKSDFKTIEPGKVRMYVCGLTVYDKAHVGHAMSAIVFDIIRRYLQYSGYEVTHVMNYTDVDDKIIQRANMLGKDAFELAEEYIAQYDHQLEVLNVLPATITPRATREIPQIISMIRELGEGDNAYEVDGDVYFRVNHFKEYGKLSGRKLEDMQAGARIGIDERKENPMDFALWKASKPEEPAWDSPWGKGRPGWHIECSAMCMHHLGEQIDIHGGGNDLIFPHHENEIAQTESITGKPFARYWVHNGMMQISGEKMSKSLGNLVPIEDFLKEHEPDLLRMAILNSSYRHPLTWGEDVLFQAERSLERLRHALRAFESDGSGTGEEVEKSLRDQMQATASGFDESMDDDFNTAGSLGFLFDLVRAINQAIDAQAGEEIIKEAQSLLRERMQIFGLRPDRYQVSTEQTEAFIGLLVAVRDDLRDQKLWSLSDKIRDELLELGVILEDSKTGTTWRWK